MSFGQPVFLLGLLLVPVMALFIAWAARRHKAALKKLGEPGLVERLSASVNWRGRLWRNALWLAGLTLVIVALARPQWGNEPQTVEQEGIQVMVALDVSTSMLAEDVAPSRLTRAKRQIADLMNRLDGDEIGLVVFSGASFIQFPLTADYSTARTFLDNADPSIISRQGTAIADAIQTALRGFDENSTSQRVIVIMTDGETHEGDTLGAARAAAEQGVIIYTVGFGSPEGAPIPEYDPFGQLAGYKTDAAGNTVLSRLNEATLQEIANLANGEYYRASDGSELNALIADLNTLQTGRFEQREATRQVERFQIFLLAAFILLATMELIPDRASKRRRQRVTDALGRVARVGR